MCESLDSVPGSDSRVTRKQNLNPKPSLAHARSKQVAESVPPPRMKSCTNRVYCAIRREQKTASMAP